VSIEVIDADGHLFEDYADIAEFFSGPLKGRGPKVRFFPDDHLHIGTGSLFPRADKDQPRRKRGTPEDWLEFLERAGISQTVIYPSGGLAIGMVVDVDLSVAFARAYNDWLHERYLKRSERLKGAGLLPIADVQESIAEMRRAAGELGMSALLLPSNGQALGKHLGDRMYWPLFAEAERLGCVLAIHGGKHHQLGFVDTFGVYYGVHALGHPLSLLIQCTGMITHGIFEKFPNLRLAFLEGGSCWMPFLMERLDRSYETHSDQSHRREILGPNGDEKPSEYIKRLVRDGRLFVGFDVGEEILGYAVKRTGRKAFLYASDFPHEGFGPKYARQEIQAILDRNDLDDEDKKAILGGNAKDLYKL
jgi:predicted TIM-barrel fold metal-dependent hydrolase